MPGGGCQAGVAGELGAEALEAFGAVVVLEKERKCGVGLAPDAVAVWSDDLAPFPGAAPLGPPLVEVAAGTGARRAEQAAKEAVGPDEVGEALAGREVVARGPCAGCDRRGRCRSPRRQPLRRGGRGPSGTGTGCPQVWGRKRSTMSRAYSSARRIRARRSPVKPTSATWAVVRTRWSSRSRQTSRSRSVSRPTIASSRASMSRQPRRVPPVRARAEPCAAPWRRGGMRSA